MKALNENSLKSLQGEIASADGYSVPAGEEEAGESNSTTAQ
jgi:hypothetical protein